MRDWCERLCSIRFQIEGRDHTVAIMMAVVVGSLLVLLSYRDGRFQLPVIAVYLLGYVGMLYWPLFVMSGHKRRQERLLNRVRAQYVFAIRELMAGRERDARRYLKRIRNIEGLWKFGASRPYRMALCAFVAVTNTFIGFCHVLAYGALNAYPKPTSLLDQSLLLWGNPWLLAFVSGIAMMFSMPWALDSYSIAARPWAEFYGDRLAAALRAGRGVEEAPQHEGPELPPEGVSARELLGLNHNFTRADLRRAWLGLARELHPDRWMSSSQAVREMKEAALKRVNAARDELLPQAL